MRESVRTRGAGGKPRRHCRANHPRAIRAPRAREMGTRSVCSQISSSQLARDTAGAPPRSAESRVSGERSARGARASAATATATGEPLWCAVACDGRASAARPTRARAAATAAALFPTPTTRSSPAPRRARDEALLREGDVGHERDDLAPDALRVKHVEHELVRPLGRVDEAGHDDRWLSLNVNQHFLLLHVVFFDVLVAIGVKDERAPAATQHHGPGVRCGVDPSVRAARAHGETTTASELLVVTV